MVGSLRRRGVNSLGRSLIRQVSDRIFAQERLGENAMQRGYRIVNAITVVMLALSFAPEAMAQTPGGGGGTVTGDPAVPNSWRWTLGLGAGIAPDYEGSEDYDVVPIPLVIRRNARTKTERPSPGVRHCGVSGHRAAAAARRLRDGLGCKQKGNNGNRYGVDDPIRALHGLLPSRVPEVTRSVTSRTNLLRNAPNLSPSRGRYHLASC